MKTQNPFYMALQKAIYTSQGENGPKALILGDYSSAGFTILNELLACNEIASELKSEPNPVFAPLTLTEIAPCEDMQAEMDRNSVMLNISEQITNINNAYPSDLLRKFILGEPSEMIRKAPFNNCVVFIESQHNLETLDTPSLLESILTTLNETGIICGDTLDRTHDEMNILATFAESKGLILKTFGRNWWLDNPKPRQSKAQIQKTIE